MLIEQEAGRQMSASRAKKAFCHCFCALTFARSARASPLCVVFEPVAVETSSAVLEK